jgi:hypothetical protein
MNYAADGTATQLAGNQAATAKQHDPQRYEVGPAAVGDFSVVAF